MSKQIGLTYQKLVEYELLKRDFVISETLGDYSPYDLICDWQGKVNRIQIRSTHNRPRTTKNRGYKLICCSWNKKEYLTKKDCDFIIAITGKKNDCYIIPIDNIKQRTILLHPDKEEYRRDYTQKNIYKWEEYLGMWDLLK